MSLAHRAIRLLTVIVIVTGLLAALTPGLAKASHSATLGVGTCQGAAEISLDPGEVVSIQACFRSSDGPMAQHKVMFVEDGPSPSDLVEAVTDDEGRARINISSPNFGISRVTACDLNGCFTPVKVSWLVAGVAPPSDESPAPPDLLSSSAAPVVPPVRADLGTPAMGLGFACGRGPGAPATDAPGHIEVASVSEITRSHPSTGISRPGIRVVTKANLISGAVLYGEPSVVFISSVLDGHPVAEGGDFPYRGFNRILAVFATPTGRFGKQELRYLEDRWASVPAEFSVAIAHERIDVIPDGAEIEGYAVGARAGGLCSSDGYGTSAPPADPPPKPVDRKSPIFITLGVLILLLVGGLALGVMRATEPPRGIIVENPTTIAVRSERGQITYDQFARPTGYVDIIELPDGGTTTVRTRIHQEGLVLDAVDFLDTTDWDDPTFEITRYDFQHDGQGRPVAFTEDTELSDGTRYRARISDIVFSPGGGVIRYSRAVTVVLSETVESQSRFETVELLHEGDATDPGPVRMAARERVERGEIRHDEEGHVAGYVSMTFAKYGGPDEQRRAELPRLMYETSRGIPRVPAISSQPNTGLSRLRHVLLRWFRQHACRVEIRLLTDEGTPFANAVIRFGDVMVRLDHRGRQTLWVLRPGDYAVIVDGDMEIEELERRAPRPHPRPRPGLVGWVNIHFVPGFVDAGFRAEVVSERVGLP